MNTIKAYRLIASAFILCFFSLCGHAAPNYIQLSSFLNQPASTTDNTLATYDSVNGKYNFDSDKSNVTVNRDGIYFVMVSVQSGAIKADDLTSSGNLDLWININNHAIDFSAVRQTNKAGSINLMITQAILSLKTGDTVSIGFTADKPGLGLITFSPSDKKEHQMKISSVNLSMYKLS